MATFRLSASVVDAVTERGLGNLRVEVWWEYASLPLTTARTHADGEFKVLLLVPEAFEGSGGGPLGLEFRVYDGQELLGSIRKVVSQERWAGDEAIDVSIQVAVQAESESQAPSGDVEPEQPRDL
jgi:hypothetical protein